MYAINIYNECMCVCIYTHTMSREDWATSSIHILGNIVSLKPPVKLSLKVARRLGNVL
jgi:hypothetical protein